MFGNKKSLQYHQKHCHEGQLTNRKPPMDIMTLATNELVGVGVSGGKQGSSSHNQSFSVPKPQQTAVPVTPKKIFACPYEGCNKSYHAKTYLIEHERLHTGKVDKRSFYLAFCLESNIICHLCLSINLNFHR